MNDLNTHLEYFFWPDGTVKEPAYLGGFADTMIRAAQAVVPALCKADFQNRGNLAFFFGGGLPGTPEAEDWETLVRYGYNDAPSAHFHAALALVMLGHLPADVMQALRWPVALADDDDDGAWSPEKEERAMERADFDRERMVDAAFGGKEKREQAEAGAAFFSKGLNKILGGDDE